jgi:hypothetical protein
LGQHHDRPGDRDEGAGLWVISCSSHLNLLPDRGDLPGLRVVSRHGQVRN